MNPTSWSLEDGHLLQNLRIKAGIDAHVFARNNTISLAQLRELESGEGQSFYNELIKRNTGIKLLKKLGHEFPLPAIQEKAPLAEDLQALAGRDTATVATNIGSANVHKPSFQLPILKHPLFLTGVFLTIGLLGFMGLPSQDPTPFERQKTAAISTETTPPSSPAAGTPSPATEQEAAWTSTAAAQGAPSSPTPLPVSLAPNSDAPRLASLACEEQHRLNSLSHTPSNPLKPGNYIYIEARTDSQLCVLDSQNKLSTFTLKAGMNQKVHGAAPFLLNASNWQGLQVFFQGRPVRVEQDGNPHLMLNSLPL